MIIVAFIIVIFVTILTITSFPVSMMKQIFIFVVLVNSINSS